MLLPNSAELNDQTLQFSKFFCEIIITVVSLYLFLIEMRELYIAGFGEYWEDKSNFIDLVSIFLVITNVVRSEFGNSNDVMFWRMQSWAALFIWFSFLLFLKSLQSFSYLVRMIQMVIIDMLPFMVIFIIGVIAFADSFQSIKEILIL